jgi:nucleotide-binding universal stress UspA family protein
MNGSLSAGAWIAPRRITVGVDGSPNSVAALRRAVAQAGQRHAELEIVHVMDPGADSRAVAAGVQQLANVIGQAFPDGLGIPVRYVVEPGVPWAVLVRQSGGAELMVIGAREHSEEGNPLGGATVPLCLDRALCVVDVCADHAPHGSEPPRLIGDPA